MRTESKRSAQRTLRLSVLMAAVAAAVLVTHAPVLDAGAVSFDDSLYLFENPTFRQPGWPAVRQFFGEVFTSSTVEGYYEPLTLTSLMLDVKAGGRADDLRPFHRTSLALHAMNTMLIVGLLYALFGEPWAAAAAGLLFGLHPLTVEPVAWVWERKTLLATFFALWALIAFVRYANCGLRIANCGMKKGESNHRLQSAIVRAWYGMSLASFVLAVLAKPTSLPLPVLLIVLDYWPLRRLNRSRWRSALLEKAPFFVVAGVFTAITLISTRQNSGIILSGEHSPLRVPLRMCYLIAFYLGKMILPVNLSSAYAAPKPMALSNSTVLLATGVTTLLIVAMAVSLRRTRALAAGFLFFLFAILPTLGIVGYSWVIASDKYVYLPAVGILLMLAWGLGELRIADCGLRNGEQKSAARKSQASSWCVVVIVLVLAAAEAFATRQYLARWKDTETLTLHMLALNPDAPTVHNQLGNVLAVRGDSAAAMEHYHHALRAEPLFYSAHYNLAIELAKIGRADEAIYHLNESLRVRPNFAKAHGNLAVALAGKGQIESAIHHFRRSLELEPQSHRMHSNFANVLARQGRVEEAIQHYEAALRLNPDYAEAHNNLAIVLSAQGRTDEAIDHYAAALAVQPNFAEGHNNLGLSLAMKGRIEEAIAQFQFALRVRPVYADARYNLGTALESQGRLDEAIAEYRTALRIDPAHTNAQQSLQIAISKRAGSQPG